MAFRLWAFSSVVVIPSWPGKNIMIEKYYLVSRFKNKSREIVN